MTIEIFKKKYKKLYKTYIKNIRKATKELNLDITRITETLNLQLEFLYDYYTAAYAEDNTSEELKLKLTTLEEALQEYEGYKQCLVDSWMLVYAFQNNVNVSEEKLKLTLKELDESRTTHWNTFLDLIKVNMENWYIEDEN